LFFSSISAEHTTTFARDVSKDAKAQALKIVLHFGGDLHRPLHGEDNDDKGGNTQNVTFAGQGDLCAWGKCWGRG
jgi:hypothetical protein